MEVECAVTAYSAQVTDNPRQFRTWKAFLEVLAGLGRLDHQEWFEKAIGYHPKIPALWFIYFSYLLKCGLRTELRRVFTRSLQTMPITLHHLLWDFIVKNVIQTNFFPPVTQRNLVFRLCMLFPQRKLGMIKHLKESGDYHEAAKMLLDQLGNRLDDDGSMDYQTNKLWLELCELISHHGKEIRLKNAASVLRYGATRTRNLVGKNAHESMRELSKEAAQQGKKTRKTQKVEMEDERGHFWVYLAEYYIRQGYFEKARKIYEEALGKITNVADFTLVFDSYVHMLEHLLTAGEGVKMFDSKRELNLERLETLLDRRAELLSNVRLVTRYNDIHEWIHRANIFTKQLAKETEKEKRATLYQQAIDTFEKALDTVDTSEPLVYSNLALLWNAYAHLYVNVQQPKEARQTWERAVNAEMSYDRTQVFMYYCAFEQSFDTQRCLEISRKAVANRQKGMTKSLKLWNLNLEWELKLGSWDSRKATFKQMCALKVVTPMTILKYALALKEGQHFEESFRVLEQGVLMFVWPNVQDIWLIYLSDFVERFKDTNLECTRDLFEQVLTICPSADAAKFYLLFGYFEENYGMEAHALRIYWRAIDEVPDPEKLTFYYLIFRRTAEFGNLLNTRPVCDRILEHANQMKEVPLIRKVINKFGKLYANMEESQGEVKRARVIYAYTAEYWVPEQGLTIFEEWRDFEQKYGNEFSFREMLRVKRSVEARAEFKV